jgi:hypothetical protein
MEQSFGLSFFLKKQKHYDNGDGHVYVRITVDGQSIDFSTKRRCNKKDWNVRSGRLIGKDESTMAFNTYLDTFRQKVFEAKRKLIELDLIVSCENIKDILLGRKADTKKYMLLELFKYHNDQVKSLIGKEYAVGTHTIFETTYKHTAAFLSSRYKLDDIDITKLKFEFIEEFEYWLKTVPKCDHNTSIKYMSNVRKIVNRCVRNGWLEKDPFLGFKMTKREVEKIALTELEIAIINAKQFLTQRLTLVRDIFIFSCYTGLAYIDIKKLIHSEIFIGVDGEKWIYSKRQKTDVPAKIPLLPAALKILTKYDADPYCQTRGAYRFTTLTCQPFCKGLRAIQ